MEKKPAMVRRTKVLKFVREQSDIYEQLSKGNADPNFLEAYSFLISKMTEAFNIDVEEMRK